MFTFFVRRFTCTFVAGEGDLFLLPREASDLDLEDLDDDDEEDLVESEDDDGEDVDEDELDEEEVDLEEDRDLLDERSRFLRLGLRAIRVYYF